MPESLNGYVLGWCQENGWTDVFVDHSRYWAFPPGAVMPLPVPTAVFEGFHDHYPKKEQYLYGLSLFLFVGAVVLSLGYQSPMPLVFVFCICAIATAYFDEQI